MYSASKLSSTMFQKNRAWVAGRHRLAIYNASHPNLVSHNLCCNFAQLAWKCIAHLSSAAIYNWPGTILFRTTVKLQRTTHLNCVPHKSLLLWHNYVSHNLILHNLHLKFIIYFFGQNSHFQLLICSPPDPRPKILYASGYSPRYLCQFLSIYPAH